MTAKLPFYPFRGEQLRQIAYRPPRKGEHYWNPDARMVAVATFDWPDSFPNAPAYPILAPPTTPEGEG
jgi:hypothetical protein